MVLLGIKEEFLPDYSDYNSIDRIQVGTKYAYCIGGNITDSNPMNKIDSDYKGGTTYTYDSSMICNNFVSNKSNNLEISGNKYLWNTPNGIPFPFSTIYSGFTEPSSYIPITLIGNYYNIYDNNNIIDSMNKCSIINDTYRCEMATHSLDSSYSFGDASFIDSSINMFEESYNYTDILYDGLKVHTPDVNKPYAEKGCVADYGFQIGDNLCNGEFGLLGDTAYVCPYYKPICDFQCGSSLGKCNYKTNYKTKL